ncbi:MAG: ABC transporter substrate-binding protein [Myxococcota bacterium]|nr:ABC transporter substrate-binding protein [Myxococcota bacterium]
MRNLSPLIALSLVLLAGCGSGETDPAGGEGTPAAEAASPRELQTVTIGVSPVMSSSGVFIALERGYFAEEGIEADTTTFASSGAELLPSLVKGDLMVGGGNISAGLYNAFNDGHGLRIVADKGTVKEGCGYLALIAGKQEVPDGDPARFKLEKGDRMATTAPGVSQEIVTERWAQHYGLELGDIELLHMPYTSFLPALENGSIQAAVEIEPHVARAVDEGIAIRIAGDEDVYADQQSAAIFFSEKFITEQPELAQGWMNAYVRGLRDYNDAFVHGVNREETVQLLIKWTKVKDAALYDKMVPVGLSPDGAMIVDSLRADAEWLQAHEYVKQPVDMAVVVDTSWANKAVQKLGPYQPPQATAEAAPTAAGDE